jgi:PAT family beta-lactamase induction signal transducer AmpG
VNGPTPLTPRRLFPWLGLTAFASGLPYALVNETAPVLYKAEGVDLKEIGLLSALAFAWILKVLLAPLVDRFGTRRRWMVGTQAGLALALLAMSFLPADHVPLGAWVLLAAVALLSATQDLSVDAYAVDSTPRDWLGPASGVRVTCYRVGLVVAGGTLVARAATLGWSGTWQLAAGLLALLALASLALPSAPRLRATGPVWEQSLGSLLRRPSAAGFLLFVLLYKLGDRAMAPMTKPFLQDRGFTLAQLGDALAPLVIVSTLAGALLGGWLTRRWGPLKALLVLGLAQALSNLGYAGAAAMPSQATLWGAALLEPFCGGLGTAPFIALLMLSCDRLHAATQYALLTALMGLVGGTIGIGSGFLVSDIGYGWYFALTCLLALPAFLLLPSVRRWLTSAPSPQETAAVFD